jgi:hypothetical protein
MPQFTLKTVALSVALACFGLAAIKLCISLGRANVTDGGALLFIASGWSGAAALGAAIGALVHRKLLWAMMGIAVLALVALMLPTIH